MIDKITGAQHKYTSHILFSKNTSPRLSEFVLSIASMRIFKSINCKQMQIKISTQFVKINLEIGRAGIYW